MVAPTGEGDFLGFGCSGRPKRTGFVKTLSDQHSITFSSIDTRETGHESGSPDETCYFTEFWIHAGSMLYSSVLGKWLCRSGFPSARERV